MSVPPPPNEWGSQPPTGGQPVGAEPWGPPPGGQPGGVPPWGPPPGPPRRRGGKGKWILAGIAVLAVIAVTVVITVLVVGKNSGGESPTPTNGNGSEIASANDKGPVGIITEDPTCDAWARIGEWTARCEQKAVDWGDRDQSVPATAWTPEQRTMYETVGKAMSSAADQTVELVKTTPHRVMRELYEQFIAYWRAFAEQHPDLRASEDRIWQELSTDSVGACREYLLCDRLSVCATAAPLIPAAAPPTTVSPPGDPANPQRFLTTQILFARTGSPLLEKVSPTPLLGGRSIRDIPATQWTPEQKAINDAVAPIMTTYADDLEQLGRRSDNPTLEDFAVLVGAVSARVCEGTADLHDGRYLSREARPRISASTVNAACKAVGSHG